MCFLMSETGGVWETLNNKWKSFHVKESVKKQFVASMLALIVLSHIGRSLWLEAVFPDLLRT